MHPLQKHIKGRLPIRLMDDFVQRGSTKKFSGGAEAAVEDATGEGRGRDSSLGTR